MSETTSKTMTGDGGSIGIKAEYTDMRRVGELLITLSGTFFDYSVSVGGYALNPDVITSTVFAPVEAGQATGKLATAGLGLGANAVEFGARGAFLIGAVEAYEITDTALSAVETGITNTVAFGLGAATPAIAVIGGMKFLEVATLTWGTDQVRGFFDSSYQPRGYGQILAGQAGDMLGWLESNPEVVDLITRGAPGFVNGLTFPIPLPGRPTTYNQVIERLLTTGGTFGFFRDGDCTVQPTTTMGGQSDIRSLSDAITSLGEIDEFDQDDSDSDNSPDYSRIRVIESVGDDGVTRWIVQIPSTQSWDPSAGPAANDLTACLNEMGGHNSTLASAVQESMRQAGVPHGAPVMLNGFSLGGITAGQLAADPSFTSNYDVEAVLTAGAPIARFDIDDSIQVLSLEHEEDLIPHLDGYDNPDRLNWTTLTDVTPYMPDSKGGKIPAHNTQTYAETARAAQSFDAKSVDDYMDTAELFFDGKQTITDFRAERIG